MITLLYLVVGLTMLVVGAEWLVKGASRLAEGVGVSPLVIGLTVVAFGTSAPELAVSVSSAVKGNAEIALGNVVGSNIFNVLFILGLSSLITPLVVSQRVVRIDVPLMIVASAALIVCSLDGSIGRLDGSILFTGLLIYTIWCVVQSRKESQETRLQYDLEFGSHVDGPVGSTGRENADGRCPEGGQQTERSPAKGGVASPWLVSTVWILAGLGLLVVGSNLLVTSATTLARWLGASDLLIGLTIVAAGTSLPEVATSIMAAVRGERDIAVGNVVGSNLFNILGVLGLTGIVADQGVHVSEAAMRFDIPVMLVAAVACLPIFFTGHVIARWEGALFLGYYGIYLTLLILQATHSAAADHLEWLTAAILIPLTVATLLTGTVRWYRRGPA